MGVNFILNFMRNPNMNFILFSEVTRSKPMLKLNAIFNRTLLKDKKEDIGIQSRAQPTILLYLLNDNFLPSFTFTTIDTNFFSNLLQKTLEFF